MNSFLNLFNKEKNNNDKIVAQDACVETNGSENSNASAVPLSERMSLDKLFGQEEARFCDFYDFNSNQFSTISTFHWHSKSKKGLETIDVDWLYSDFWLRISKGEARVDEEGHVKNVRFIIEELFFIEVESIYYCLCDKSGRPIDNIVYKSRLDYVENNNRFLFARSSTETPLNDLSVCILRVDFRDKELGVLYSKEGVFFPKNLTKDEIEVCRRIRDIQYSEKTKKINRGEYYISTIKWGILGQEKLQKLEQLYPPVFLEGYYRVKEAHEKRSRRPSRKASTSTPEQTIYYYVKTLFPDAISRYKVEPNLEADIFIPSLNVAIEYDGSYWHKDKIEQDIKKVNELETKGIYQIHVRDADLPSLPTHNGVVFLHGVKDFPGLHTNEYVTNIVRELANHCEDQTVKEELSRFSLSYEQIKKDNSYIIQGVFEEEVDPNITNSCMFKYWNYEKNKGLNPKTIPLKSSAKTWYMCPNGIEKYMDVRYIGDNLLCDQNCDSCERGICPDLGMCEEDCDLVNGYLRNSVLGNSQKSFLNTVSHKIWSYSGAFTLLKQFINNELNEEENERLLDVLFLKRPSLSSINDYEYMFKGNVGCTIRDREQLLSIKECYYKLGGKVVLPLLEIDNIISDFDSCNSLLEFWHWQLNETNMDKKISKSNIAADIYRFIANPKKTTDKTIKQCLLAFIDRESLFDDPVRNGNPVSKRWNEKTIKYLIKQGKHVLNNERAFLL